MDIKLVITVKLKVVFSGNYHVIRMEQSTVMPVMSVFNKLF